MTTDMSPTPVAAPQTEAPAHVDTTETTPANAEAPATTEDGVAGIEAGVADIAIGAPQSELHRACAEGRIEDVRTILGRGIDSLESLDIATGCTPIVLAVTNGHAEVVRELLSAGAIVPPPGLTMDPAMIAILYPHAQPMYGVPPPFGMPHQFFQPGYYGAGAPAHVSRKDSSGSPNGQTNGARETNGNNPNLPPAEVAKTIPCRNFPNCKYGVSCLFFHPHQQPGFFQPPQGYYEGGFVPYGGAPFFPGAQEFVPQANGEAAQADGAAVAAPSTEENGEAKADGAAPHVPSAGAPAFIPNGIPMSPNGEMLNGFVGSPNGAFMSPPLMQGPGAPADAAAFYATSPPQFQPFLPNGGAYAGGHGRRQSFGGQFNGNGGHPKPYHGKKPSFSGGPRPWGPGGRPGGSSHLGQWKDGNPPPCAFFREGKCRNGEFCKFPHIDAEGNDVRNPDVIRGLIPPMPTRPLRVGGMMHGRGTSYGQHQQMLAAKQAQAAAVAAGVTETAEDGVTTPETSTSSEKDVSAGPNGASSTLPPKPSSSLPPSRAGSQPGHTRGPNSRQHSPNGAPRRGGGPRYANGHTSRSSSNGGDKKPAPPQRIPRADEFPSLGGSPTLNTERQASWGKTAAQVLSEPAPAKPEAVKEGEDKDVQDKEEPKDEVKAEAEAPVVTMDSDSEQDAVIVSVSTTPNPEVAKAKLASAVSFASVISSESAPVALKA